MQRHRGIPLIAATMLAVTAVGAAAASSGITPEQRDSDWYQAAQQELEHNSKVRDDNKKPKNVILFVGDGMGMSTVTAARILEGQLVGEDGEENMLSFEQFDNVALSKTYNVDAQVPDSAGTMTAMMTGAKTDIGVIGVDETVERGQCGTGNELRSWMEAAESAGMATGVVSTARLTHATPAAAYAHSVDRNWENDSDVPAGCSQADIAAQLIDFPFGDGLEVALGGGRREFLPEDAPDPEDPGAFGQRTDGRNLAEEWSAREGAETVFDKAGFDSIDPATTSHLLGLFERSHMEYEHDRAGDTGGEPSLTEMTEKAIAMVDRDPKGKGAEDGTSGFALVVESGRIDHAHHGTNAYRALTETIEFSNAIRRAVELVDLRETQIVVTADHGHTLTISGYPERGNDILGVAGQDAHGTDYTTLGYINGASVGYDHDHSENEVYDAADAPYFHGPDADRRAPAEDGPTTDPDYQQQTLVELPSETHTGEDVGIYAQGPLAHRYRGVVEQNYIGTSIFDALRLAR